MARFRRTDRINEQLRQEIAILVRDEVRDPRVGVVTVTAVESSPELDHAKVYITTLGDEEEKEAALAGLRSAAPFIRGQLGRRLHVRRVPELHFQIDRVIEEATRIELLLREALPGGSDASDSDASDSDASDSEAGERNQAASEDRGEG
jgi:ribosome-binding factor A